MRASLASSNRCENEAFTLGKGGTPDHDQYDFGQVCARSVVRSDMSRSFQVGLAAILIYVALLCGVPVAAAAYEARAPGYQCAVSQPVPAEAVLERGATGTFSIWPVGLECRYLSASDAELIVSPGWFLSGLAIGSLTALLGLFVLTALSMVQSAQLHRRTVDS